MNKRTDSTNKMQSQQRQGLVVIYEVNFSAQRRHETNNGAKKQKTGKCEMYRITFWKASQEIPRFF
jgi:hypothetical protein